MDWAKLEAMTDKVVLDAYAERVRHIPYAQTGNGRPQPDTGRQAREFSAVVYNPEEKAVVSPGTGKISKVEVGTARIAINRRDHPGIIIRRGDTMQALDQAGQPNMRVGKVTEHYNGIIVAEVSREVEP